ASIFRRAMCAIAALICMSLVSAGRAHAQAGAATTKTAPPKVSPVGSPNPNVPWKGDLDGMIKRRMIRVLMPYSQTHYFIDHGVQRGVTFDALRQFEDELNTKLKTGNLRVHVVFVPTSRDKLQAALLEGRGDIVAANVTITPGRQELVDFVEPTFDNVKELV